MEKKKNGILDLKLLKMIGFSNSYKKVIFLCMSRIFLYRILQKYLLFYIFLNLYYLFNFIKHVYLDYKNQFVYNL
jgi:hypothetical protein